MNIYQVLRISEKLLARHLTEVVNLQSATLLHHVVIRVVLPGSIKKNSHLHLTEATTHASLRDNVHIIKEEAPGHGQVDVDKKLLFSPTGATNC